MHVKYIILGGLGACPPRKIGGFRKLLGCLFVPSDPAMVSKCTIAITSDACSRYISVRYWGGLQPPQPPLPTPMYNLCTVSHFTVLFLLFLHLLFLLCNLVLKRGNSITTALIRIIYSSNLART